MDYLYPELNTRFIFFKKDDPLRDLLLINKKQTPQTNLLKYAKPLETGVERDETSVYIYRKKDISDYLRPWRGTPIDCMFKTVPTKKQLGEFLDKIFPPKEWIHDGYYWTQHVSTTPSGRQEALKLDKDLTSRLRREGARPIFLCDIRRNLYKQCFDEIIRQELTCNQRRGLILLKCRDELHSDLDKMAKLYHSQWAVGVRMAMQVTAKRKSIKRVAEEIKLVFHVWRGKRDMLELRLATLKGANVKEKPSPDAANAYLLAKLKAENKLLQQQLNNVTTSEDVSGILGTRKKGKPTKKSNLSDDEENEDDGSSITSLATDGVTHSKESNAESDQPSTSKTNII